MADIDVTAGPPISENKHMILGEIAQHLTFTAFTQAPDNPAELTAQEKTDWAAYRKAWSDLSKINFTAKHNGFDERSTNDAPVNIPLPSGWVQTSRAWGDLPPVFCRTSELDIYDPTSVITNRDGDAWAGEIRFVCIPAMDGSDGFMVQSSYAEAAGRCPYID